MRSEASRDRHGDVMLLDCKAIHRHFVDALTATSARTNTNVSQIGDRLPPGQSCIVSSS
jgi:hypothetical protein